MTKKIKETSNNETVVKTEEGKTLNQTVSALSSDAALFNREINQFNVEAETKKQRTATIVKNIFVYTFLTLCAIAAFLPFYWMIISSFKTEAEYRESVPTFFPRTFQWKNYSVVLSQTGAGASFGRILLNTLVVGL